MRTTSLGSRLRSGPWINRSLRGAALFALALPACAAGPGEPVALPDADYDRFVAGVQPILEARCANPACHGSLERPLEVYAVHQHRIDPDDTFLDTPLSEEELEWNFNRARVFLMDLETAERSLLLLKPLEPGAGVAEHGGGTVFESPEDYEYQVIYAWIDDALAREVR